MSFLKIKPGDKPLRGTTIERARAAYLRARGLEGAEATLAIVRLLTRPADQVQSRAQQFLDRMQEDISEARQINTFNARLLEYRKAIARLAEYRLAEGRGPLTEEVPTGAVAEDGTPITETVIVAPAIDPLPATIERDVLDQVTGEVTGTETIPNPQIERDDAERAAALAVIDSTPQTVKNFTSASA